MSGWTKLGAFALVICCFWYFFYEDQQMSALILQLTALWLFVREVSHILEERTRRPGRSRRRSKFPLKHLSLD